MSYFGFHVKPELLWCAEVQGYEVKVSFGETSGERWPLNAYIRRRAHGYWSVVNSDIATFQTSWLGSLHEVMDKLRALDAEFLLRADPL